ncbi:MAG: thioredoxin [Candidatus Omnitrophica bacterium]|nr:thioredoxin [Candidatus Omnitrophota bacterium]MDD5352043.1 thioredoxin [Candidatus Omnitrophota bacterium]MDD5551173.1 thioredoxin [Candidatus Omnitrophota bacterium]
MGININDANFKQEVLEVDIPVLVDFWAVWCGPCLRLAPVIEQIAKEYKGKLKVCKLNVDDASNTASNYDIMSIPTLAIFKKGKIVDRIVGALPKAEIETTIKKYIN